VYSREDDSTSELWTANVTESKYLNKPVYILTSRRTFSAAEAAAYHMKYVTHAKIVGETTGGGAHRVRGVALDDKFTLLLPFGRSMNVVTKTDWEGTGVMPDIPATPDQAVAVAQLEALRTLAPSPERQQEVARLRALLGIGKAP
jgi:C-terminal processing protease CtpA/Prc